MGLGELISVVVGAVDRKQRVIWNNIHSQRLFHEYSLKIISLRWSEGEGRKFNANAIKSLLLNSLCALCCYSLFNKRHRIFAFLLLLSHPTAGWRAAPNASCCCSILFIKILWNLYTYKRQWTVYKREDDARKALCSSLVMSRILSISC